MNNVINKLVSERAWLLLMFAGLVAAILYFNLKEITVSVEVGILLGAFIKTFLDAVVDNIKTTEVKRAAVQSAMDGDEVSELRALVHELEN